MNRHSSIRFRIYRVVLLFLTAMVLGVSLAAQQMNTLGSTTPAATPASEGFTFLPVHLYDSGGQLAWTAVVSDVNGDGKPDLLVLNNNGERGSGDGSVGVLLGTGKGTFRHAGIYDAGGVGLIG